MVTQDAYLKKLLVDGNLTTVTSTTIVIMQAFVIRTRSFYRLVFPRLACLSDIPLLQKSVRFRRQSSLLGIGASIAFAVYHETSFTHNDSDDLERTASRSTKPGNSNSTSAFEQDMTRQDVLIPDWTDNGIYRIDVASLAA